MGYYGNETQGGSHASLRRPKENLIEKVENRMELTNKTYEQGRARGARIIFPRFLVSDHCVQKRS